MPEQAILEEEVEETQEIEFPREKIQANAALKVSSVDEDSRTVVAVISSASVDRDKEVLLPKGANFDNYLKNPVVLWGHQSSDPPIGKALWVKRGQKQITAKVKFATTERAEEIWELFKGGYLNAFSVGFIPIKGHQPTPDEIRKMPEWAEARFVYDEWELLEFSPVTVPANPDALRLALESGKVKICKEVKKDMAIKDEKETDIDAVKQVLILRPKKIALKKPSIKLKEITEKPSKEDKKAAILNELREAEFKRLGVVYRSN